jgi:hypothetical protein
MKSRGTIYCAPTQRPPIRVLRRGEARRGLPYKEVSIVDFDTRSGTHVTFFFMPMYLFTCIQVNEAKLF